MCIQLEGQELCLSVVPGTRAQGTVSPPVNGDALIIVGLDSLFHGLGGLPPFLTGQCGPGAKGTAGVDGYAVLQW